MFVYVASAFKIWDTQVFFFFFRNIKRRDLILSRTKTQSRVVATELWRAREGMSVWQANLIWVLSRRGWFVCCRINVSTISRLRRRITAREHSPSTSSIAHSYIWLLQDYLHVNNFKSLDIKSQLMPDAPVRWAAATIKTPFVISDTHAHTHNEMSP